jgi:amidohydrolase
MKYEITDKDFEDLVSWRRDLHRLAELGFQEVKTSAFLKEKLSSIGISSFRKIAKTGLVFDLLPEDKSGWSNPFILLRADMDALPIHEETGLSFQSETPGVMHACGHDTHMSMLLKSVDKLISANLLCPVRVFFQPAEEGLGGAKASLEDGLLSENQDLGRSPDFAVGAHIWSELPYGQVVATTGPCMAGTFRFDIEIKGLGSHAATPQFSKDAVVISSQLVNSLQTFVSRNCDPFDPVVLTVGELKAGSNWNIIAENASLSGTIRVFDQRLFEEIPSKIENFVKEYVSSFGADAEIKFTEYAGPLINDEKITELVAGVAQKIEEVSLVDREYKTMGGEDFALIAKEIPSCFFFIGAARGDVDNILSHHNPKFDIEEKALKVGAKVFLGVVESCS